MTILRLSSCALQVSDDPLASGLWCGMEACPGKRQGSALFLNFIDGQVTLILCLIIVGQEVSVETAGYYIGQQSCSVSYYSIVILWITCLETSSTLYSLKSNINAKCFLLSRSNKVRQYLTTLYLLKVLNAVLSCSFFYSTALHI